MKGEVTQAENEKENKVEVKEIEVGESVDQAKGNYLGIFNDRSAWLATKKKVYTSISDSRWLTASNWLYTTLFRYTRNRSFVAVACCVFV